MRGDGRIYNRGTDEKPNYWIAHNVDGTEFRESAHTDDPKKAMRLLRSRLKLTAVHELTGAKLIGPEDRKRTIPDILDGLAAHFRVTGKASAQNLSLIRMAKLDLGFHVSGMPQKLSRKEQYEYAEKHGIPVRALSLKTKDVTRFIEKRQADGAPSASINRETQILGQAFKLAELPAPKITRLPEDNRRMGFFTEPEVCNLLAILPDDGLRDFVEFGWLTGWRKGEIASLTWADIDDEVIRLRAEHSKNGEPRTVPLIGALADLIARRRRVPVEGCLLVFHRTGQEIREFRKSWQSACCTVGLGQIVCKKCEAVVKGHRCTACRKQAMFQYHGRIFHDLRRSAVRNMVNAGVAQVTAMSISGHRTASMFRRYAIIGLADQRRALEQTAEFLASRRTATPASERIQ